MQPNYVPCPHCQNQLIDDGRFVGQIVQCPTCQKQFRMPFQAVVVKPQAAVPSQDPFSFVNSPSPKASRYIAPRPKSSPFPWIVAGFFGILIIGIGGWAFFGSQDRSKKSSNGTTLKQVAGKQKTPPINPTNDVSSAKTVRPEKPSADLIAKLNDISPVVRRDAIEEIGKFGPRAEQAVPALITSLEDPQTMSEAAIALGRIGPGAKAAKSTLVRALDPDQLQRKTLQMILDQIDPQAGQKYGVLQQKRAELKLCRSKETLADSNIQLTEAKGATASEIGQVYKAAAVASQAVLEKLEEVAQLELELQGFNHQ